MRFRIHFTHQDGTEDSFHVSGDTVNEIKERANRGVAERNGKEPWAEPIDQDETRACVEPEEG